jgi:hypothetical protein
MLSRIQIFRWARPLGLSLYGLVLLFTSSWQGALAAPPAKWGSVIAVDQKTRSFTCRRSTGVDWICKTTSKTIFTVGKTKGSWSDIKKGVLVECVYHHEGQAAIADSIQIERQTAQPLKE